MHLAEDQTLAASFAGAELEGRKPPPSSQRTIANKSAVAAEWHLPFREAGCCVTFGSGQLGTHKSYAAKGRTVRPDLATMTASSQCGPYHRMR